VAYLRSSGVHVGLAFQHVDDLLGICGDPAVTGKPVHSDLRNQKKSLPVVAALTSETPAGHELAAL
jgi:geranylgeranyl diphosphate synthase type I